MAVWDYHRAHRYLRGTLCAPVLNGRLSDPRLLNFRQLRGMSLDCHAPVFM
jgi:hypothetical protein